MLAGMSPDELIVPPMPSPLLKCQLDILAWMCYNRANPS